MMGRSGEIGTGTPQSFFFIFLLSSILVLFLGVGWVRGINVNVRYDQTDTNGSERANNVPEALPK